MERQNAASPFSFSNFNTITPPSSPMKFGFSSTDSGSSSPVAGDTVPGLSATVPSWLLGTSFVSTDNSTCKLYRVLPITVCHAFQFLFSAFVNRYLKNLAILLLLSTNSQFCLCSTLVFECELINCDFVIFRTDYYKQLFCGFTIISHFAFFGFRNYYYGISHFNFFSLWKSICVNFFTTTTNRLSTGIW